MANCENLCTAAKCAELERRINELESLINNHLSLAVPQAHQFNSSVNVNADLSDRSLRIQVEVEDIGVNADTVTLPFVTQDEFNDHVNQDIPTAHDYKPFVAVDFFNESGVLVVSVDGESDSDVINVNNETDVFVDVFPQDDYSVIKVTVNGSSDEDYFQLPDPTIEVQNELKFTGTNDYGSQLTSTVTVNGQQASDSVTIDVTSDVELSGSRRGNGFDLTVRVDDGQDTIFIPDYIGGGYDVDLSAYATKAELNAHTNTGLSGSHPNDLDLQIGMSFVEDDLRVCVEIEGLLSNCGQINLSGFLGQDIDMELLLQILANTDRIYKILGGDLWGNPDSEDISLKIKPEEYIRTIGKAQYKTDVDEGKELTITSLVQLLGAFSSVDYFRSGLHRLPATTFNSLINTEQGNQELKIYDTLSFQEWIIRNIDALAGEYPLEIKSKAKDSNNRDVEQTITFANNAEALAEITALIIGLVQDTDDTLNASLRTMAEARAAANAAIVAVDYAAANAEYLGYKGKEKSKEVNLSFTPGAKTLRDTFKPSTQKIISWINQDKETLVELVKRTLIGAEIIKAANYIPWKPGQKFTGDTIREKRDEQRTENDAKWQEFVNRTNNPTGRYKVNKPEAKIKDNTVNKNNQK
ncbi:hypothetical protein [Myxosarcina sp. GI1]|uniref:hypothetical protein n=1 Tax=Myxosarcina sp. GI1 TaxID=1541065 RepID=UPI000566C355|nr:hypothetical protein [Myxosarcina sp. GI1]